MLNLNAWLAKMNMSPRELSLELGISRSDISALAAGEMEPAPVIKWALKGLEGDGPRTLSGKKARSADVSPLDEELADERWAGETARLAMPVLIDLAMSGEFRTITYGDLHSAVIERGGKGDVGTLSKYAYPCGRIARAVETAAETIDDNVPPLTALVVNANTGLPSPGIDNFLRDYLGRSETKGWSKSPAKRREAVEQIWRDIFAYPRWAEVQAAVGLTGDPNYDR